MERGVFRAEEFTLPMFSVSALVVGSGAAGFNAAISLVKEGVRDTAILTEGRYMGTSRNTGSDKQTYYKLTTSGDTPDSIRKMAETLFSGQCMDGDLALAEAALSLRGFFHLVDIGVPFPSNSSGEYAGYKTDHDPNQRGASAGPLTSRFMTEALEREAERLGVPVLDGWQVVELLADGAGEDRRVRGLLALNLNATGEEDRYAVFAADSVVYAVGGEAGMYKTSVYPGSQTGGMGPALRMGAKGKNLTESQYGIASIQFRWNLSGTYQQVLPRYISTDPDGSEEREFLDEWFSSPEKLAEAIFLKGYQWPFDPRKTAEEGSSLIDLLVYQETVLLGRRVFLDYRRNPAVLETNGRFDPSTLPKTAFEYLQKSDGLGDTPIVRLASMNPAAIELYRTHGIDLGNEPLEIAVCAQHNNGGLAGNHWWESNVRRFFPVGECNGSHGVYRPGGSALNAGQVGSLRAAQYSARRYGDKPLQPEEMEARFAAQAADTIRFGQNALRSEAPAFDLAAEREQLQARMSRDGANIRSAEGVERALRENRVQQARWAEPSISRTNQLRSMYRIRDLLVSQQVYLEAIADYIACGGVSRGSYLIYDPNGQKPHERLPEAFRFSLEDKGFGTSVQEMAYRPEGSVAHWRPVRPIPEEDTWFESVWHDWREGKIYEA